MVTYCQAGDTARVTLPDGSIQDFSDTPITINVEYIGEFENNYDPQGYRITFWSTNNNKYLSPICYEYKIVNYYGWAIWNMQWMTAVYWRDCEGIWQGVNAIYPSAPDLLVDKSVTCGNPETPLGGVHLTITGNSGTILLSQSYSTNNYSVECIQGCPPNTLDCGDCCLDCNSIFNSISDIRRLISTIRQS
ncbi:hypothetical protein H5968_18735 [Sphaerospermopsis sp. LEGE 00249]|uniref:hypothetical protein n=1 Tax=Sphaerospermopsis sp. LEGE 00249 TaxID=1380707 RepID=UPI00164CE1E0|nr:hypothetical protein [Sphaerospermopsis sp. LEGE 00249]MBC5797134.1 hypothetical protein [Sphaerospermopsis sp. LEGE 00249]